MSFSSDIQKRRLTIATIFTFAFMAGYALSQGMVGTLLPRIIDYFDLNLGAASTINITNEIGNTSAMLCALFIVDRLDKHYLLMVMGFLFGLALLVFGLSPAFGLLLFARIIIGFTGGLLDNVCATYVSDLYGERRARFVSILHTLFAIGNMAGPQFSSLCYKIGGWRLSFIISGAVLAAAGVLLFVLTRLIGKPRTAVGTEKQASTGIPYAAIVKRKNLWWLGIGSFLIAGETYLVMALPTYLDYLDPEVFTTGYCATIMTSYSLGMLISRTGLAALSEKISTASYVRASSLLAGLLFAGMLLTRDPVIWLLGMFLFGVIAGASYTERFVLSCQEFPLYSSTASAFTGIFAALGNIAFNAVIGGLADAELYTEGMYLVSGALVLAFLILVFMYRAPETVGKEV